MSENQTTVKSFSDQSLDQEQAKVLTCGTQRVLKFDRRPRLEAEIWSLLVFCLIRKSIKTNSGAFGTSIGRL